MQSRPDPSFAPVNGPAPSPDEDDHLTIKKLKTQHSHSLGLCAPTPFTPIQQIISTPPLVQVQPAIPTPPTQIPIVDLEVSHDEQGLHSDVLDLLVNSFTNPEQPFSFTPIPEATFVAPAIAEQPTNDPAEPPRVE